MLLTVAQCQDLYARAKASFAATEKEAAAAHARGAGSSSVGGPGLQPFDELCSIVGCVVHRRVCVLACELCHLLCVVAEHTTCS